MNGSGFHWFLDERWQTLHTHNARCLLRELQQCCAACSVFNAKMRVSLLDGPS